MSATLIHNSRHLPMPGILWGDYPQRAADAEASGLVARLDRAWNALGLRLPGTRGAAYRRFATRVGARAVSLDCADRDAWQKRLHAVRAGLARHGMNEALALEAFALAAVACRQTLGFTPYASQIEAARAMQEQQLAEMATGEGKTVAVAVAAAVAALAGTPVHVITANDYLAARDAKALQDFYRACGLTVAAVTQPLDRGARRAAYGADITYCSAKELAFDYLRDGMLRPRAQSDLGRRARRLAAGQDSTSGTLLRGLCMAIIDEADTVLIDEARMPLVLSQAAQQGDSAAFFSSAVKLARTLEAGIDFKLQAERRVTLAAAGVAKIAAWQAALGPYVDQRRHREDTLCQALAALHLYRRDRDYVVREGVVTIVDEHSGRAAPGRVWSRGLQQLIELKEGCAPGRAVETIAQITFQRFFKRYLRLAGMSGTLRGAERELRAVYGLGVVRIAPRTPPRRIVAPLQLHADPAKLWQAVAQRVGAIHATGRPLLIGTASVAESMQLSQALAAAHLPHAVLNARHHQDEAALVACAGDAGRITVATGMAGRGTDIRLGPGVAERGGLHVILCQHNSARRIDRQFIGRAARNGEPGSVDTMLALDGPLFKRWLPRRWREFLLGRAQPPAWLARLTATLPQRLEERLQRSQRRTLERLDKQRERALDFCQRTAA